MDTDIYWLKKKMEMGAEYAVTQLFYDNRKYFDFVERARQAGVTIPIIPGIKPFKKLSQLSMIPKTFKVDLPRGTDPRGSEVQHRCGSSASGYRMVRAAVQRADSPWRPKPPLLLGRSYRQHQGSSQTNLLNNGQSTVDN